MLLLFNHLGKQKAGASKQSWRCLGLLYGCPKESLSAALELANDQRPMFMNQLQTTVSWACEDDLVCLGSER